MNTKNNILSIVVATLLVNCGGGGGDGSSALTSETTSKAIVCLDANSNSICEKNEVSEEVNSWEDYGDYQQNRQLHARLLDTNSSYPLAYNGNDGLVLRATAGSTKITPFSTIVYYAYKEDKLYNTLQEAQEAITRDFPNINQSAEFLSRLKLAISSNQNEQKAMVVGTYINELRKKGIDSISEISIEQSDIQNYKESLENKDTAKPVDTNETTEVVDTNKTSEVTDTNDTTEVVVNPPIDTSNLLTHLTFSTYFEYDIEDILDKMLSEDWRSAKDSKFRSTSSNGSKVVFGARRHNSLSIIDVSDKTFKYNTFATLKDSAQRHPDATTGASENYIDEVYITKDNYIYIRIKAKTYTRTHDKNTYGLFKTKLNTDDTVDTYENSLRIPEQIKNFTLSPNEKVVFVYAGYDLSAYDNSFNKIATIKLTAYSLDGMAAYDENTVYILEDDDISKYTINGDTFKKNENIFTSPIKSPGFMKIVKNNIILTNGTDKEAGTINIDKNETKSVNVNDFTSIAAVSEDGKYLATIGNDLVITNLNLMEVQDKTDAGTFDDRLTFIGNDKVAFSDGEFGVKIVSLTDTGKVITSEDKIKDVVVDIEKQISNGKPLTNITSDLTLVDELNGVKIKWSTTIPDEINVTKNDENITSGKVTRPDYEDGDVAGILTLHATGFDTTYIKNYYVTIKKAPQTLPSPVETSMASYLDYIATNDDGRGFITTVYNVETISSYKVEDDGSLTQTDSNVSYNVGEKFVNVDISNSYVIALAKNENNATQGRIYSAKMKDDISLDRNITSSQSITIGEAKSLNLSKDKTKAVILVDKPDDTLVAQIYNISSNGTISLENSVNMTQSYAYQIGSITVNNEGTTLYYISGGAIHIQDIDSGSDISKDVEGANSLLVGTDRVFVMAKGNIYSYDSSLTDEKKITLDSGGTSWSGPEIKIGGFRQIDGENYLIISLKAVTDGKGGIYRLKVLDDGSLEENGFLQGDSYYQKLIISKDGKKIFFMINDKNINVIQ